MEIDHLGRLTKTKPATHFFNYFLPTRTVRKSLRQNSPPIFFCFLFLLCYRLAASDDLKG